MCQHRNHQLGCPGPHGMIGSGSGSGASSDAGSGSSSGSGSGSFGGPDPVFGSSSFVVSPTLPTADAWLSDTSCESSSPLLVLSNGSCSNGRLVVVLRCATFCVVQVLCCWKNVGWYPTEASLSGTGRATAGAGSNGTTTSSKC